MPYKRRVCEVCAADFVPPHRLMNSVDDGYLRLCSGCRRERKAVEANDRGSDSPPVHLNAAPLRQVVFDLETWGLDRGWGVTLVGSFLEHGSGGKSVLTTYTLREYDAWKNGQRSNDRDLVADLLRKLGASHIAYAHNGERFDVRWLRSVALKYGLEMPRVKLVDPCQIAWKKYRLGRNSLEAVADFLGVGEKYHISPDVWRAAVLDDSEEAWETLVKRCESDVKILNAVAGRVTGDLGMIDYSGSWR